MSRNVYVCADWVWNLFGSVVVVEILGIMARSFVKVDEIEMVDDELKNKVGVVVYGSLGRENGRENCITTIKKNKRKKVSITRIQVSVHAIRQFLF